MNINVIIEDGTRDTHWISLYLKGIYSGARRRSAAVCEYTENDIDALGESEGCAALLGNSRAWLAATAAKCASAGISPIVIGCDARDNFRHASYVYMDYGEAVYMLLDYLESHGREKTALFSVNTDSSTDMIKTDSFLAYKNGKYKTDDVYFFNETSGNSCREFITRAGEYNAVICTNDAAALLLLQQLQSNGYSVPSDIFLATFGDMSLNFSGGMSLTLAKLDCIEIGRQAVEVFRMLSGKSRLGGIAATVKCELVVGDTTDRLAPDKKVGWVNRPADEKKQRYYDDPYVNKIYLVEKIFSSCDEIDIEILRCILGGMKYCDIAEKIHISESTIKYRLKRIIGIAGASDRDEVLDVMKMFI